jgi:hypothetical protein
MEEVTIYKFQLKAIYEALRLTSNIHESHKLRTSHDRQVIHAKQFAINALEGKKDERVPYPV